MNDLADNDENLDDINRYVLEKSGLDIHLKHGKKRESVLDGKNLHMKNQIAMQ